MKTLRPFLAMIFFALLATGIQATIHTVHNDPLYSAQYSTIAAAITAASATDTILVHGSPVGYPNVTLTKQLTIIGPGHDPANGPAASFSYWSLNAGSEGSHLEGIQFTYMYVAVPDIELKGCKSIQFVTIYSGGDNTLITGCVFVGSNLSIDAGAENVEIRNTYFSETGNANSISALNSTSLIHNNVFVHSSTSTSSANIIFGASNAFAVFVDNVFYTATVACFNPAVGPNFIFQNNLSYSTAGALVSMGPNNLDNVAPTWDLGGDYPTFNYAHDYNMLSGSPLTGASDGGQVGVHGGPYPFTNHGLPRNIPRVTDTNILTPYVPVDGTIDVNFQAVQGQP